MALTGIQERWLLPADYNLTPTAAEASRTNPMCVELALDGFSTLYAINHKMHISAADLAAGFPLVEIVNPSTFPAPPASTGATHTTLTGAQALVGVTVSSSLTDELILAFSTPAAAPAGTTIQVLLSKNPASIAAYP